MKRIHRPSIRLLFIVACLILATQTLIISVSAAGNTLIVPTNFPTIQRAVDAASPGDTIQILGGNAFTENVIRDFSGFAGGSLTFEGVEVEGQKPIWTGSFDIQGNGSGLVSDLTFTGIHFNNPASTGYFMNETDSLSGDLIFSNNTITHGNHGFLSSTTNAINHQILIENNAITVGNAPGNQHIFAFTMGALGQPRVNSRVIVRNNTVTNGGTTNLLQLTESVSVGVVSYDTDFYDNVINGGGGLGHIPSTSATAPVGDSAHSLRVYNNQHTNATQSLVGVSLTVGNLWVTNNYVTGAAALNNIALIRAAGTANSSWTTSITDNVIDYPSTAATVGNAAGIMISGISGYGDGGRPSIYIARNTISTADVDVPGIATSGQGGGSMTGGFLIIGNNFSGVDGSGVRIANTGSAFGYNVDLRNNIFGASQLTSRCNACTGFTVSMPANGQNLATFLPAQGNTFNNAAAQINVVNPPVNINSSQTIVSPIAVNDTLTTTRGVAATINVLNNDLVTTGIGTALLRFVTLTSEQGGTVSFIGGTVTYTPPAGYQGEDAFHYAMTDSTGKLVSGKVSVTVERGSGVSVSKPTASVNEAGSTTDSYEVVLDSAPTEIVRIEIAGSADVTVNPTVLTFIPANWSTPQTVIVTAVNDRIYEANHSSAIKHTVTSGDPEYNQISVDDMIVSVTDNESITFGIRDEQNQDDGVSDAAENVSPVYFNIFAVINANGSGPFGFDQNFTILYAPVTNSSATGGGTDYTLAAGMVTFSATQSLVENRIIQTIFAQITNDLLDEDNESFTIQLGVDETGTTGSYDDGINSAGAAQLRSHTYTIVDDDTAGVTLSRALVNISEAGTTGTYTVVLNAQPTSNVTVTITGNTQASGSPSPLTFTPANWQIPQTVTVTAVDDALFEGVHTATLTHTVASNDPKYNNLTVNAVTAEITDNDSSIRLSKLTANVVEGGATDTYSIVYPSRTSTPARIDLSVSPRIKLPRLGVGREPAASSAAILRALPDKSDRDRRQTPTVGDKVP